MSTKIYTGIRFHKATDIFHLHDELVQLGARAREEVTDIILDQVVKWVEATEPFTYESGVQMLNFLHDEYRENTAKGMRSMLDADLSITVYPFHGKFYGQYFCDYRPVIDWLEIQDFFEDFAYWNNTDEPEDITHEEWEFRGQIWDDLLPYNAVPAECGLNIKLIDGGRALWQARCRLSERAQPVEKKA
jgi:hypothetical protein